MDSFIVLSFLLAAVAPSFGARLPILTQNEAPMFAEEYIVGGKKAEVGAWPWQGSLSTLGYLHQCGCALVDTWWVVTAAHCTSTPSFLVSVVLGMHDKFRFKGDPTSYGISKRIRHGDWTGDGSKGFLDDLALLKLRRPANVDSQFIGIVDMAPADADFVGAECYITGWGMTRAGNLFLPNVLRQAETTAMTNTKCEEMFTELIGPGMIQDGHICVGGRGTESGCMGDSGGPLVCKLDDVWHLAGVTSWGMGNCDPSAPSVYTRISHYRKWLTDNSNGDL